MSNTIRYQALDREQLAGKGIDDNACLNYIRRQQTAPLNLAEFFHAQAAFPLVFIRQSDGSFMPLAVLGLSEGENLFVDARGQWLADFYQPASLRRYPFYTQPLLREDLATPVAELQKPIFVDTAALTEKAEALFVANGVAGPAWPQKESFIGEYLSAERQTLAFCEQLRELDLLEAFDAQVQPVSGEPLRLKGMYRVNEDRLNALAANQVKSLMQEGALSRIYAHLMSLENFARLLDRRQQKQHKNNK